MKKMTMLLLFILYSDSVLKEDVEMEKKGKAGAMLWGGVVVVFELLIFLGLIGIAIVEKNFAYFIVAILPLLVGGYTAYFIFQRLKEIDFEKEKKDEYEKY